MAKERAAVRILQLCKKHFKTYDEDNDGFIRFKEFQAFLRVGNNMFSAESISPPSTKNVFARLDKSNDAHLTLLQAHEASAALESAAWQMRARQGRIL